MEYQKLKIDLKNMRRCWAITGVAGFIGSHLLEHLLLLDQEVIGLDNLSTGNLGNLALVEDIVGPEKFKNFTFVNGDLCSLNTCLEVCKGVEIVLHQGALGSVPRSIKDPVSSAQSNVNGFVNIAFAAKEQGVKRMVYASSSSVYGTDESSSKLEWRIGNLLSPYAVTKRVNELYAAVFSQLYSTQLVGLRYFNVFGSRQDPHGAYAAVIPKWVDQLIRGEKCVINGDGSISRDFCFIENVVQANLIAALQSLDILHSASGYIAAESSVPDNSAIFNIAVGHSTSLTELFYLIRDALAEQHPAVSESEPEYGPFRIGDIKNSLADISKASTVLKYEPQYTLAQGLSKALKNWGN